VNGSANTGNIGSYAGSYANYVWQNQTAIYLASIYTSHFTVASQGFASRGFSLHVRFPHPPVCNFKLLIYLHCLNKVAFCRLQSRHNMAHLVSPLPST
jgi:hypothetical protein